MRGAPLLIPLLVLGTAAFDLTLGPEQLSKLGLKPGQQINLQIPMDKVEFVNGKGNQHPSRSTDPEAQQLADLDCHRLPQQVMPEGVIFPPRSSPRLPSLSL